MIRSVKYSGNNPICQVRQPHSTLSSTQHLNPNNSGYTVSLTDVLINRHQFHALPDTPTS